MVDYTTTMEVSPPNVACNDDEPATRGSEGLTYNPCVLKARFTSAMMSRFFRVPAAKKREVPSATRPERESSTVTTASWMEKVTSAVDTRRAPVATAPPDVSSAVAVAAAEDAPIAPLFCT